MPRMPPKVKNGRSKKDTIKSDISDKVREIKQRQENWMKQRQNSLTHKRPSSSDDAQVQGHANRSGDKLQVNAKRRPYSGPDVHPIVKSSSQFTQKPNQITDTCSLNEGHNERKVNAQFNSWVKRRAERIEDDTSSEKCEQYNDRITEPNHPDFYQYDEQSTASSIMRERSREADLIRSSTSSRSHQPLSPEMFDSLADQIVSRVKNELKISHDRPEKSQRKTYNANDYDRHETPSDDQLNRSAEFDSHYCPQCSNLMLPPHCPMMVIPCGHTFCEVCINRESHCPGCTKQINSLTANLMLQQIIMDFKGKRKQESTHGTVSNSVLIDHRTKSAKKMNASDYLEEYHTLTMRCEVLDAEADSIKEQVQHIKHQIDREKRQVDHIFQEEERVAQEIHNLEERLRELRSHREEYNSHFVELEEQKEEHCKRLSLIRDTVRQLHKDKERVKKLAETS